MELEIMKQLGALEEAVRSVVSSAQKMETRALEERKEIYDRIDAIKDEVSRLATDLKVHDEKLETMEPVVKDINNRQQQSMGEDRLGKFVWTAIISAATVLVTVVIQIFNYLHK